MWRYGRRWRQERDGRGGCGGGSGGGGGGGGVLIGEGRRDGCRRRRRRKGGLIKPDLCHGAFVAVGEAGGRG